jgi:hypothetical protein
MVQPLTYLDVVVNKGRCLVFGLQMLPIQSGKFSALSESQTSLVPRQITTVSPRWKRIQLLLGQRSLWVAVFQNQSLNFKFLQKLECTFPRLGKLFGAAVQFVCSEMVVLAAHNSGESPRHPGLKAESYHWIREKD